MATSPGAGRVYHVSGQTRSLLYTVDPPAPQEGASFGFWDANLGSDVNDDGIDDFVVSAPGQVIEGETVGQVYVLSGADGTLVHTHQPAGGLRRDRALRRRLRRERHCPRRPQDSNLGFAAAELGDVNGDGSPDYQLSAPRFDEGEGESAVENSGRSYIIEGDTGDVIYTLVNPEPGDQARFGQADSDGAALGDITGDGTPDIYVHSFLADESPPEGLTLENAGRVFLFDGATGDFIRKLDDPDPTAGALFGAAHASAGGIDRDGSADLIVSGRGGNHGRVIIFGGSGLDSVLKNFDDPGNQVGALFGSSIASVGDVNGDGAPDYFISSGAADAEGVENVGTAYAFVSQVPAPPPPPPTPRRLVTPCPAGNSAGVACQALTAGWYRVGARRARRRLPRAVRPRRLLLLRSLRGLRGGASGTAPAGSGDSPPRRLRRVSVRRRARGRLAPLSSSRRARVAAPRVLL